MKTFKIGDSVRVVGPGIELGKIVDTRLDSVGKVWYLVHDAARGPNKGRLVWADEHDIGTPIIKRHDPSFNHHWDHMPS